MRRWQGFLCGLTALALLSPAGAADAPVNLRFSFWVPPAHPLVKATKPGPTTSPNNPAAR